MRSRFQLLTIISIVFINLLGCSDQKLASRIEPNPPAEFTTSSPGVLKRYDAFYVAPVEVYEIEEDYLRRVSDAEVRNLGEELRTKLIRKLDQRSTTLPQPARNVALIKIALTDVSTNYAMFQLTPGVLFPNPMRGGASIEAQFIDSVSGKTVAQFRDSRSGERRGFFSGLTEWDGVKTAFDEWAQLLASEIR